ncbi:MAG: hypothetical protein EA425_12945 [Puniceicoccaceae bacterium]|nr:MAG: hypothetical protein EA425_12945 [Puniceicoccaceae bacterium]
MPSGPVPGGFFVRRPGADVAAPEREENRGRTLPISCGRQKTAWFESDVLPAGSGRVWVASQAERRWIESETLPAPLMPLDPSFHHELYDSLHDSALQRKFRRLCPMPYGVVFLPWAGMTESEMRGHFRIMRELGFTNLKQTMPSPEWPRERILEIALEEGVIPFWYGEGGWEEVSPELLTTLGLPADLPPAEARLHPAVRRHQEQILYRRIHYANIDLPVEGQTLQDAGLAEWNTREIQLHNDPELRADAIPLFKQWVRGRYATIEELVRAWNMNEVGISPEPYGSWDDFEADAGLERQGRRDYGFIRDVLRFKADHTLGRIRLAVRLARERDADEPQRAGGEMGLFLPFAWRGTDMEGIAEEMTGAGSFYPSLHLAWHFEEVDYEVARCIYMQASLAADWFKGGWSATWESTGGPQQFSGGKGWDARAAAGLPGFTVDEGTISQLLLSYLAAGFRGAGLWCWNYRRAGWEAGEYALLDRQHRPSPRAIRAGKIAQAANRLKEELWTARKEPLVGVVVNWDSEAIWAAVSVPNRDQFRHHPIQARIGVSRALINGNVPWEHVTPRDLERGLAGRYRVLMLPCHLALPQHLLELLGNYAEAGGRVVADLPAGWFDERGRVLETGAGSAFERLFGVELADFQYSNNPRRSLDGRLLEGFVADLNPTTAVVVEAYEEGRPAVTENRIGKGTAVLLGHEAGRELFRPGRGREEALLRERMLGGLPLPYVCEEAVVYRLAAPEADHYFFVNDGPSCTAVLRTPHYSYRMATDPVTGEELSLGDPISLQPHSARWVRMQA